MKQPTLLSFNFRSLSYDQDGRPPSTSGENTNACSPLIPVVLLSEKAFQGPKNFRIDTCPPAILHSSYSYTKKDNPLALAKFFLVRMSRRVDSLDSDFNVSF